MSNKQLLQSAGDGTAVPAGYVGEIVPGTLSVVTATFSGGNAGIATMGSRTLGVGVWLVFAEEIAYNNARPSTGISIGGSDLYDGSSVIVDGKYVASWGATATIGEYPTFRVNHTVNYTVASGTKVISFRLRCDASSGTPNSGSVTNRAYGFIRAVRIA